MDIRTHHPILDAHSVAHPQIAAVPIVRKGTAIDPLHEQHAEGKSDSLSLHVGGKH